MSDDELLMRRVCDGDHGAFTELVERHTQRFFSLAFRTLNNQGDAEDIVQTAFITLWQKPFAWRADRSSFTTWFYRVVLNACYDLHRKNRRTVQLDQPTLESYLSPAESEQSLLDKQQQQVIRQQYLEQAIADLPASQRDALNLVIYSELPQKHAASIMGISLKALESLLVRARRSLKQTIERHWTLDKPACIAKLD